MFDSSVDLTPLYSALNQALALFLAGLVPIATTALGLWLRQHFKFLGAKTDATITSAFNTALANGGAIALNSLEHYEGEHSTVAVKSWLAAHAAQYAIDHNQDFMKRFAGLTFDDVATKALAAIPPIAVQPGTVTLPSGATITLGKPSPTGQSDAQEKAETAALNKAQ